MNLREGFRRELCDVSGVDGRWKLIGVLIAVLLVILLVVAIGRLTRS